MAQATAGEMSSAVHATANAKVTEWNRSAPGANVGIVSGGFKVSPCCSMLRITLVLATTSVVNLTITDGSQARAIGVNGNTAITAETWWTGVVPVRNNTTGAGVNGTSLTEFTYNIEVETDGAIWLLWVDEVTGPLS